MSETAKKWFESDTAVTRKRTGASWAKNVGVFLPKITRPAFEKFGFPAAALVTDWAAIVGRDLASYTMPEKLTWPPLQSHMGEEEPYAARDKGAKTGATLVLRTEGPRALEIQFKSQQIMDRINTFFGYRAVTAIRIVQAPLTKSERVDLSPKKPAKPMPATHIEEIENDRLRAALKKLEDGVSRR